MKLELKDMQISKGEVIQKSDGNDDLKHDDNILNPTSFALIIKRNLSSAWYKEIPELDISGRLKSIVVSVQRLTFHIFFISLQICTQSIVLFSLFKCIDEPIEQRLSIADVHSIKEHDRRSK